MVVFELGKNVYICLMLGKKVKARMAYVGTPHPANGQPILVFEEGDVIDLLKDDGDQWYEVSWSDFKECSLLTWWVTFKCL